MNAIQYYIIDAFIKKPLSHDLYEDDAVDSAITRDDLHRQEGLLAGLDESYSTDSDDEDSTHPKSQPKAAESRESESHLTEDHSPVPPYEPPSSSSSSREPQA